MKSQLDNVIQELKKLANDSRQNIMLPDNILISNYEQEIGSYFYEDYKKVLKEIGNIFYGTIELAFLTDDKKYYRKLSLVLNDARAQSLPKDSLPIYEDNGDYYCLPPNNTIRYWTTNSYNEEIWLG